MQTHTVFKINRAGQGYVHVWPGQSPLLGLKIVDESLPPLEACPSAPCVAYAATRLAANQVLLVVGSYWPQHRDEYGRLGLSFWHGILCDLADSGHQQVRALSNLLAGLVQRYEQDYEAIGKLMARTASEKQAGDWSEAMARLTPKSCRLDYETRRKVQAFGLNPGQMPKRANLKSSAASNRHPAIPYLLTLLLGRQGVKQIAGGSLSPLEVGRYRYISVPARVAGYQEIDLAKPLAVKKAVVPIEARPRRRMAASGLAGVLGGVVVATLLLGFFLYILLPPPQPTSTPVTDATMQTGTPPATAMPAETGQPASDVTPTGLPTMTLEATVSPTVTLEPTITPTITSTHVMKLCAENQKLSEACQYEHVILDQHFEGGVWTISGSLVPTSKAGPSNEEILILVDGEQIYSSHAAEAGKSASFKENIELKPGQHKVIVRYGPNPDAPEPAAPVEVTLQISFMPGG